MTQRQIEVTYLAYPSENELPPAEQHLLAAAREALENSYSPYSNFKVGAAVLLDNGETLGGANYENAAYPLCICAEQGVLAAAASRFPTVATVAIAIAIRNPMLLVLQPAAPCGGCRQVICETERRNGRPMKVILQGEVGEVFVFEKGRDLLPLSFDETYL